MLPGGTSVAERWVFNTSARIDSSPTISGGAVYFGCDDRQVYKLDARNGTLWWNFTTSDVVKGSPAVVGGRVFSTTFSVLSLEVYYRFLPLYQVGEE